MLRRIVGVASALAFVWAVFVWASGGTTIAIAGLRVSSTDPVRPMLAALVLAAIYLVTSGRQRVRDDAIRVSAIARPARLAAALAITVAVIAVSQSSNTAAGADAYAYVTQADLLLSGRLTVPVPIANDVPWPRPLSTFVPFGYAAVTSDAAIASAVGPGLPLLMALFKAIGGHAALFLVVPITAALLIWSTFAIGRGLGSTGLGLGASWLVATSPAFLMMTKEPMSDVPAAALWAFATWKVMETSRWSTLVAGIAAAIAILIRPNLVPLAVPLGVWLLWPRPDPDLRHRVRALVVFSVPVVLACLTIAGINATLFGSPLVSGYGAAGQLFSIANVPINGLRYGGWLVETQTLLFPLGVLAAGPVCLRRSPSSRSRCTRSTFLSTRGGSCVCCCLPGPHSRSGPCHSSRQCHDSPVLARV